MSDFAIRPARDEDSAFILDAWLKGLRDVDQTGMLVGKVSREWWETWHRWMQDRLYDPDVSAVVAHLEGSENILLGFAIAMSRVDVPNWSCLHWCYVKQPYRGLGIARALIEAAGAVEPRCSLWSPHLRRHPEWQYCPEFIKEPVT